jgi:acetyl esterase/lipase
MPFICSLFVFALGVGTIPNAAAAEQSVKDIAYGSASYQKFDVFHDSAVTNGPVIMLLHGRGGKKTDWQPYRQFFLDLGFVVVTPQYDLNTDPLTDMTTVYNWLVANVAGYGGNAAKMNVAGTSAGSWVGSSLAYVRELPFNAFVGLAGIYTGDLMGGGTARPVSSVDAGDPPAFLVHGLADTKVNYSSSVNFDAALTVAGIESHLYLLPDVGHTDAKAAVFGDPDNEALRTDLVEFLTRVNLVSAPAPTPTPDPEPTPDQRPRRRWWWRHR